MNEAKTYGVFNAMIDVIAAPRTAMTEVKRNPKWFWWPLLLVLVVTVGVFGAYYSWVDFDWFIDEMVRTQMDPGADPAAIEQMRSFMTPGRQIGFAAVGIVIMTFAIYAIQAAYLNIVNKVAGDPEIGYGQWFSFSAWTAFVGIFNALAVVVVMLMSENNQVGPEQLAPLSMNALFMHTAPGSDWFTWGNSLSLVNIWMLVLMAIGFATWTKSGIAKSAAIVSAPWVAIFGIWALLVAM